MATETITAPVRVAKLGSQKKDIDLKVATTVADVLKKADIEARGYEPMLNGSPCKMSDIVQPGDVLALSPQIRGGD